MKRGYIKFTYAKAYDPLHTVCDVQEVKELEKYVAKLELELDELQKAEHNREYKQCHRCGSDRIVVSYECKWCMCTELKAVARDFFSTCSICGGKDAYGGSKERPKDKQKVLSVAKNNHRITANIFSDYVTAYIRRTLSAIAQKGSIMVFENMLLKLQKGYNVKQKALIRIGFESAIELICTKAPNNKYEQFCPDCHHIDKCFDLISACEYFKKA